MSAPGFVVRGKGEAASINLASHGAGRLINASAFGIVPSRSWFEGLPLFVTDFVQRGK
jgi:hypothetical protein